MAPHSDYRAIVSLRVELLQRQKKWHEGTMFDVLKEMNLLMEMLGVYFCPYCSWL